ncbi:hypothetical protein ANN_05794 [Periplaneta americana]|uniref:DUF4817 domain-containing protein n=1 Tax=Periplaneta americana TaxID=6978 RepID=A0ABQ8TDT1_PERAM|nr:hypothetical protein ANN_05794 [Periplaneta americana]
MPFVYTHQEYGDIVYVYGLCAGNATAAVLAYQARFPNRRIPSAQIRKIFGAKRDEVTGEWRKLHNAELHALYSSPDIIRNIKSRRLRWASYVARIGESRNAYRVLVWRPEGKRPLGDRDVDGRIILKWI